jgi:hypothetical protein
LRAGVNMHRINSNTGFFQNLHNNPLAGGSK